MAEENITQNKIALSLLEKYVKGQLVTIDRHDVTKPSVIGRIAEMDHCSEKRGEPNSVLVKNHTPNSNGIVVPYEDIRGYRIHQNI